MVMEPPPQKPPSSSPPNPNPKPQPSICEECKLNPPKYKCPGCSIRSCSLPCVKSHKQRTSCTGKRSRTEFVPLSNFDDTLLLSDYNLLEETKRVAESAQKLRDELCGPSHSKLPFRLKGLKSVAAGRKIELLILPRGMSMREKNKTWFDKRKNLLFWTVEWRFRSTNVVLIDNGIDENVSLCSVIEKHLKPCPGNSQLRPFCEEKLESLKFFIRKNAKGVKSPFQELNIRAPIGQQLANIVILEYPIIHVFLPSASLDFEILKEADQSPQISEHKEPVTDSNLPSPKGVLFKEEEIEDMSADPSVLDLMKYLNPEVEDESRFANAIIPFSKELETEANGSIYGPIPKEYEDLMEYDDPEYCGIDSNQNLRDAYSELIRQANPDDFLDLDKYLEVDQGDELEEGEIQ